jgi:hypothetical protein
MRYIALILLIALGLVGCSSSPPPITAHGTLTVYANPVRSLNVQTAYPDIADGSQVTVTDDSGTVIGTGALTYSKSQTFVFLRETAAKYGQTVAYLVPDVAIYTFTVTGLPRGLQRYGFTVGRNRGTIWVPLSQVENPGLTLGSVAVVVRHHREVRGR